ncbi:MAG: hypothetical protein KGR98_00485 [Verrucomicrobia bacterium]|nr:hypothetical protein [Verrucomicrobiota bacterium]MDE3099582.1 hypothetical protein [Verrucomicrobiota bacterium]
MMATFNSRFRAALGIAIFLAVPFFAVAQTNFQAQATREFQRALGNYRSETNDAAAWEFARACFNLADLATNNSQHASIARQGIVACQRLIARNPRSARGHYYLALNLGQLARTESVGALGLVRKMRAEFETALALNPRVDHAGPTRGLGLLYRDAPGWPFSIGNRRKAQQYLQQAGAMAPDFPENRLDMIESDLKWRQNDAARRELAALDALWPSAKKLLAATASPADWANWTARRAAAREKLAEIFDAGSSRRR